MRIGKNWLKVFRVLFFSCVVLVVLFSAGLKWMIDAEIKTVSAMAQAEYPGDRVEALMAFVRSEKHGFQNRNRAVWTLGQIADPKALEVLQEFYTGAECEHDQFLCQRELKKAIQRCL